MTRVAIYTRVSTPDQADDGTSLDTQSARCHDYAQERAYAVVGVYTDTYTGSKYRDRPGLSELRSLVRAGAVDVVLAFAIDRLSRNQAHLYILAEEFSDHGARLEFVTEDFEDSAVGRFIRSAKAFAAEVEREKITERTMRGKRARVASGKLLLGRVPPYGLLPNAERTGWLPNDALVPIVQRLFNEAADGRSLRHICDGLARDGIPTAEGRPLWSPGTLRNILRNPAYCGVVAGWRWHGNILRTDPADYITIASDHAGVVDSATWQLAQERLSHYIAPPRVLERPYPTLVRGLCRCGSCGRVLVTGWSDGRAHYRCDSHGDISRICPARVKISSRKLDAAVWAYVVNLLARPERLAMTRPDPHGPAARLARADKALAALEREQARVMRELTATDDPLLTATWRAALVDVSTRRRQQDAERTAALAAVETAHHASRRWVDVRDAARALAGDGSDPAARRAAVDALGLRVEVWPRDRQPRWTIYRRE